MRIEINTYNLGGVCRPYNKLNANAPPAQVTLLTIAPPNNQQDGSK